MRGLLDISLVPIPTRGAPAWVRGWRVLTRSRRFVLLADRVIGESVPVLLPRGFDSDGLSIPKPLRVLFDPFGVALLPGIAHDYAIRHRHLLAPDRSVIDVPTRAEADEYFRRLTCEVNAMPGYARLLWVATRLGSWVAWRRWAREQRV